MELVFFTMQQRYLFDTVFRSLVRGVAGGGKSLLILLKIVDILSKGNGDRAVLVAPSPFIFKCERILKANGLSVNIINNFPLKPTTLTATTTTTTTSSTTTLPDVLIMDLNDFFAVPTTTLQQYDLDSYHLFIDDLQSYTVEEYKGCAKYSEIALFIDDLYMKRIHTQLYLWACFDVLQSNGVDLNDHHITSLTHISTTKRRPLKIPIFDLTKILRNSADIIPVIQKVRTERIRYNSLHLSTSNTLRNVAGGHNITCTPVVYHELIGYAEPKHWKNFITHVLTEVLPSVMDMVASISPSDVSILYDDDVDIDKKALQQLVRHEFNCSTQTIKDFVLNNNKDDVIFDNFSNATSLEFQVVIYLLTG